VTIARISVFSRFLPDEKTPNLSYCVLIPTHSTLLFTTPEPIPMAIDFVKLNATLQNFVASTPDIQGAAVVTTDGLPLASSLANTLDEERVAAMSAAMLSLGERIGAELTRGNIDRISVEGTEGYGILTNCGEDAVFLVLASKNVKQGVLMLEIKQAIAQVKACMASGLYAVA
jgi:uncharacterized protein